MVLVGGNRKFEGAILEASLCFIIETWFASTGVWYLVGLGATAVLLPASDGACWINGANLAVDGRLEASINAEVLTF